MIRSALRAVLPGAFPRQTIELRSGPGEISRLRPKPPVDIKLQRFSSLVVRQMTSTDHRAQHGKVVLEECCLLREIRRET
jgi:hypothetical protein